MSCVARRYTALTKKTRESSHRLKMKRFVAAAVAACFLCICFALRALPAPVESASSALSRAEPLDKKWIESLTMPATKDAVFYPYQNCVVFQVQRVTDSLHGNLLFQGDIIEIIRGDSKPTKNIGLEVFRSEMGGLDAKSLAGNVCVFAFNDTSHWGNLDPRRNPRQVSCFKCDYVGKTIPPNYIVKKKASLAGSCFPYVSSWIFTVLEELPLNNKYPHFQKKKIRIDKVYLKSQIVDASKLCPMFKLLEPDCEIIEGNNRVCYSADWSEAKVGEQFFCVCFPRRLEGNEILFQDLRTARLTSNADRKDWDYLGRRISMMPERINVLNENLNVLMARFWTVDRIREFCQEKNLYRDSAALAPFDFALCGAICRDNPKLGKVRWYANVMRGQPDHYQIDITKGTRHWRGYWSCSTLIEQSDESNFKKLLSAE